MFSQFANDLVCLHCAEKNFVTQWPAQGDTVPFYNQKDPGLYYVPYFALLAARPGMLSGTIIPELAIDSDVPKGFEVFFLRG